MVDQTGSWGTEATLFRRQLRQQKIAAREALPAAVHGPASQAIEAQLTDFLGSRPPETLAFCWPVRGEFDCRPLVLRLLQAGWRACQPVVLAPAAPMVFRPWTADTPMTRDRHGIPIPAVEATTVPDLVLLPLVAFDEQGYRLGYGGGYFDRTLATLAPRPQAIGVGFELARVSSVRPQDHDVPLDAVVTEAGIRRFARPA
jgi:5,10-methenyltetrahydrofolate synthetase